MDLWTPPTNLAIVDFESYYGPGCTLSTLSYTEYIRHPEFEIFGVGVAINHGMPVWYEGTPGELREQLLPLTDWDDTLMVAHNNLFDGLILTELLNIIAKAYHCTLGMARSLYFHQRNDLDSLLKRLGHKGKEHRAALTSLRGVHNPTPQQRKMLGLYCISDTFGCGTAYDDMIDLIPDEDKVFIDIILRCFTDPAIVLNKELAEQIRSTDETRKQAMFKELNIDEKILSSNIKFATLLESIGVEVPLKWSDKQEKMVPAFAKSDVGFQELQEMPEIADIMEARIESKSTQTRTRTARFIFDASGPTGRLPIGYNHNNARTGRLGGGNKSNPQNLDNNSGLRHTLTAPPGFKFLTADESQIECRLNAWHAGELPLLDIFRRGGDPYLELAKRIFDDMSLTKKGNPDERFIGKQAELSLGYGVGYVKFTHTVNYNAIKFGMPHIHIDEVFGQNVVHLYRQLRRAIVGSWRMADGYIRGILSATRAHYIQYKCYTITKDKIILPNGLCLSYPEITPEGVYKYKYNGAEIDIYGAKLIENIIQALAFIVVKWHTAIIEVEAKPEWELKIVMNTHDEVSSLVREEYVEEAKEFKLEVMRTPPNWCPDLPLDAEAEYDDRYCK